MVTNDNIIAFDEAKRKAQQAVDKLNEPAREQKSIIENIMKQVENINPELGGFEELGVLMSLPEDQFALIAPIFLDELFKSFNNVSDKLFLAQAMNVAGVNLQDLRGQYQALLESLDTEMKGFSPQKIDFLKQLLAIVYNTINDTVGIAKKVIEIPVARIHENAQIPAYAHDTDSGLDVFALDDITIAPGETKLIPTGLKVAIPRGYELQVRPKSGRALKTKLRIANTPGTIDAGYRDEIGVIIENVEPPIKSIEYEPVTNVETGQVDHLTIKNIEYGQSYTIGAGEKFAQLVLMEVPKAAFYEVADVAEITGDRGGGFGSTGLK